ncbi:alpha/beta hydrolase [Streptomyces sp. URMC 127]|uniref:alpha/beta hydrolase n=1 Tax=Streptomyces sp. URMC 127 TaxID=3423402 RepID=UPI003F1C628A
MGRFKRTLVAAALATTVVAGTAGWAAGSEQTAVTGPPAGTAEWRADHSLHRPLPDPARATPRTVAAFFAGLTEEQRKDLMARHPLVVGNLDGAPVPLRYEANARAIAAEREKALARAGNAGLPRAVREEAGKRAGLCERLLAHGRQILAFDPRGRGQVAEVFGDLAAARHTAVVVPGSDIDLATFDRTHDRYGTPAGMAAALRSEMERRAPGTPTAVIAWAGYTTPVGLGVDAATGRLAQAGAVRLERLLAGLPAAAASPAAPPPAVFCHSYGSVVCGLAASSVDRTEASDLVALGSPGMRAGSVKELHTGARVWAAARNSSDWIGNVPNVDLFGLGHGADPTSPEFGARIVPSRGAHGHTGYFAPGTDSLRNFADIALGAYASVG